MEGRSYQAPPMAALPDFRVKEAPPFSRVGVDFAGPLYVKDVKGDMSKVYIALFSCCNTRAIHLELIEDLKTQTFLRCLRRFTARRGMPALMVSDNAKTFKAVVKFLDVFCRDKTVKEFLESRRIEWRFNLERSPWWDGFFERMVGSVKRCLRKVLGYAKLSFDELNTTLIEIEITLNARPLAYIYEESDYTVLTPYHLIFGRRLSSLADHIVNINDETIDENVSSMNKKFMYLIKNLDHFGTGGAGSMSQM